MELVVGILLLALLLAVGVMLGRRIRATGGTIGAPIPAGSRGVVQAPFDPVGTVLLAGETWSARTADERPLARGVKVRLVAFEGLVAIVEPTEPGSTPPLPIPPASTPADPS